MVAVVMRRNGDRDSHSYLLGAWQFLDTAEKMGWEEHANRGHKYDPEFFITDAKTGLVKERWIGARENRKKQDLPMWVLLKTGEIPTTGDEYFSVDRRWLRYDKKHPTIVNNVPVCDLVPVRRKVPDEIPSEVKQKLDDLISIQRDVPENTTDLCV